jgi:hypothetical protein
MPVEIKELIIRAVATPSAEDREAPAPREGRLRQLAPADETQALIQECVRQVLRILQQNKER